MLLDVAARRVANLEAGITRLSDEQRAELFNPDRPYTPEAGLAAMRDGTHCWRTTRRTACRRRGTQAVAAGALDEDDEDFSQESYTERAN